MCGIAGIALRGIHRPGRTILEKMAASLVHRGPDDLGLDIHANVGLAMRRLAVIDLPGGRQPMTGMDANVAAVMNGEIYNYRSLRESLVSTGSRFRTNSDTEVMLELWRRKGNEALAMLNGMFALGVHDRSAEKVLVARDGAGIKPLYYYLSDRCFVFGSEIKALLASGFVHAALNHAALAEFMAWEYVPGSQTLLKGVQRLLPGHWLELDLVNWRHRVGNFNVMPTGTAEDRERSEKDWVEDIDRLVGEAVQGQMVSDVPVGALLSGGVDSSLVTAKMGGAKAFSIGFNARGYDESRYANKVAKHLGVPHRIEIVHPEAASLFHTLMPHMDDPIADSSIFPTYLACRLARAEVTVALSGDGGDELFGGYDAHRAQMLCRWWDRLPLWMRLHVLKNLASHLRPQVTKKGVANKFRRFVAGALEDPGLGHARWRLHAGLTMQQALFTDGALQEGSVSFGSHIEKLASEAGGRDSGNQALFVDFKSYLVDNCLAKVDRMSMACSLEVRVPLLDQAIVEAAFAMPSHLKYSIRRSKILLKRVARRYLPRDCVDRPKEGFSAPVRHWLNTSLNDELQRLLDPSRLGRIGLFNVETVGRLRWEHASGLSDHAHILWALMMFEDWRERWGVEV